jgi:hypothetical protein
MTYSDVWTGAESPERFAEEFSSRAEVEWPTWITLAPNDRVTFDGQDGWSRWRVVNRDTGEIVAASDAH